MTENGLFNLRLELTSQLMVRSSPCVLHARWLGDMGMCSLAKGSLCSLKAMVGGCHVSHGMPLGSLYMSKLRPDMPTYWKAMT